MPNPLVRQRSLSRTQYVTLPKNLMRSPDVSLEDFEVVGDWTATSGSIAADATNYKTGTHSLKLTTPSGGTATAEKTVSLTGLNTYDLFRLWIYNYNTTITDIVSWSFKISSTTDYSKCFTFTQSTSLALRWYWSLNYMPVYTMTNTGGESWSNTMIRIQVSVTAAGGKTVVMSFDDLEAGYKRIPVCMIYSDSATIGWLSAFQYALARGIRPTLFLIATTILRNDGTVMTPAQVQSLYAAGAVIASHCYTGAGTCLGDWQTQAEQEYEIAKNQQYIRNTLGCPGGERYSSFMGGGTIYDNLTAHDAFVASQAINARSGQGYLRYPYYPPGDWYNYENGPLVAGSRTYAEAIAVVDAAIAYGQYGMLEFDTIDGAGITTAQFQSLVEYIYAKQKAGLIYHLTMHEFYQVQFGPVRLPNSSEKFTIASTWSDPATILDINHESNDLKEYHAGACDTDGGNLAVAAAAALNGTSYGLSVTCPATTNQKHAGKRISLWENTHFRVRFYFDPNTCTMGAATPVILRVCENSSGNNVCAIKFMESSGYKLALNRRDDDLTDTTGTGYVITDAPHYVEMHIQRASADGVSDGVFELWIDGTLKKQYTNVKNYNSFIKGDVLKVGASSGVTAAVNGTFYIDEIKANTTGTAIGA
jgi:hypothetical protein